MVKPIVFKFGDPCPNCNVPLVAARQATAAERAQKGPEQDPVPLPPSWDTATPAQIAELGELFRCPSCGYPARFTPAQQGRAA